MLPLVREEAAACARLDKSAYLGLTAEPGCEFSDGFSSVLGHSTQGYPSHFRVLLFDSECPDSLEHVLYGHLLDR